jgi:two-component system, OmpR family, sensor histidine kinase KdpD
MFDYVIALGVVALCTAISVPLRSHLVLSTFAMLYLLGVIVVSMRCRRRAAVLNALLSVTAFYYFCVPVHDSFVLEDSNYLITLVVMLIAALVISTLTFKTRAQAADVINAEIAIQTERMRNSLLSAVSHDIKTPLASIYGAATGLLESGPLNESQRQDLVESIAVEAERLNCVVTNLLEMTRLDAGVELNRDWYPLEEILGAALTRVDKLLRGRNVVVNIPADLPLIRVDEVLIEEVFANILENAAKYTPPGTAIDVTAFESGDKVIIIIRDNGLGFPPGDEERVFDKFFRGKTEGTRGAGLGLAICKTIIQHHEGIITASNKPNGGAVLTVELPIGGTPPVVAPISESLMT